jgi:3-methyladenine DNA glycosylase AlkD
MFAKMTFDDLQQLIKSPYHEERMLAIFILVKQFNKADNQLKGKIVNLYLDNRKYINNWDLVDLSAPYILGPYLFDKDKGILIDYTVNGNLWEKRIAVLSTFYLIKQKSFDTALQIIEQLLNDKRDLINKACGWMLREIGNRDPEAEESFLKKHFKVMPRTMLRYAIEKFPEEKRLKYLKGEV